MERSMTYVWEGGSAVIGLCCTARYKKQGGLNAYWQTMSVHDSAVDVSAVTVHSLRPDTTYRFRVMWRSHLDDEARFTDVVVARTARTSPRPLFFLVSCARPPSL